MHVILADAICEASLEYIIYYVSYYIKMIDLCHYKKNRSEI